MLTVWGRRTSSNVQAVMWCIGELGLDYRRHDVGHRHGGNDTPEFLAMNPNGLVPVVQDGEETPVWEAAAINRYLAARHGDDGFWPADPVARAPIDQWAEWGKNTVATAFTVPIFWGVVRTPPRERNPQAIAKAIAGLGRLLDIADAQLARHAFIAGPEFTLADIAFGHVLYRYFDMEIERPDHPAVAAYYARLAARPAFAEHVMVSYEDLRAV